MAGAEENSSEAMGSLVRHLDAIKAATGSTVAVVHHLGKDKERGARGHSLLKAAVDTEFEVSKSRDVLVLKVTKQRDLPFHNEIFFELDVVGLGRDEDGDVVTSCVVRPADSPPANDNDQIITTEDSRLALQALQAALRQHGEAPPVGEPVPNGIIVVDVEHWRACFAVATPQKTQDARRKAFARAIDKLTKSGA